MDKKNEEHIMSYLSMLNVTKPESRKFTGITFLAMAILVALVASTFAGSSTANAASNARCMGVQNTWTVDGAVTTVAGDVNGTIIVDFSTFTLGAPNGGGWADISFDETVHTDDGDIYASAEGKFNIDPNSPNFLKIVFNTTYTVGTGDWDGASGGELVRGINGVGGTSYGHICL